MHLCQVSGDRCAATGRGSVARHQHRDPRGKPLAVLWSWLYGTRVSFSSGPIKRGSRQYLLRRDCPLIWQHAALTATQSKPREMHLSPFPLAFPSKGKKACRTGGPGTAPAFTHHPRHSPRSCPCRRPSLPGVPEQRFPGRGSPGGRAGGGSVVEAPRPAGFLVPAGGRRGEARQLPLPPSFLLSCGFVVWGVLFVCFYSRQTRCSRWPRGPVRPTRPARRSGTRCRPRPRPRLSRGGASRARLLNKQSSTFIATSREPAPVK